MTTGEASLSQQDVNRWLKACGVIASLFAIAIVAIVFAKGPFSPSPSESLIKGPGHDTDFTSSATTRPTHAAFSVEELMKRIDLEALPTQSVAEPY
jgi:hypothetical protein